MMENKNKKEIESGPTEMMGEGEAVVRVRIPKREELMGKIIQMVGGSRFFVMCSDNVERLCRIPGKIKRKIWVKEGDYVIIKPWSIGGDKRADIVWRYTRIQANWLRNRGYIREL